MARFAKFVLGLIVVAAVAAAAAYVAIEIDLIAGALVVLGALIVVALVVRIQTARAEKQGMADWKDVLEADAPDDAFFSAWTATTPTTVDGADPLHAPDEDLVIEAHTSAGLESLEEAPGPDAPEADVEADAPEADVEADAPEADVEDDLHGADPGDEAPVVPAAAHEDEGASTEDATDAGPVDGTDGGPGAADTEAGDAAAETESAADGGFPFDDPHDTWGDLPPLIPAPEADAPTPEDVEPAAPGTGSASTGDSAPAGPADPTDDDTSRPDDPASSSTATPTAGPDEPESGPLDDLFGSDDDWTRGLAPAASSGDPDDSAREPEEVLSFAGASAPAQAAPRRSLIDWTGPVHAVDEQVRSSDDILAASAATALPTPEDRPAPTGGSELARLLAKVEARLRDYE